MFNRFKERKAQKRKAKEFGAQMEVYRVLEKFENHGEFSLNMAKHQVLIEQNLAMVMMTTAEMWERFLTALYQYAWYKYYEQKYAEWRTREGALAVVAARKKYAVLTRADIMRIKQARWDEMEKDSVAMPKVEPLEFYLVRLNADRIDTKTKGSVPAGEVTVVGRYDYESGIMEMTTWKEMKKLLDEKKNDK